MKKLTQMTATIILAIVVLYVPMGSQSYITNAAFLGTAVSCSAGNTLTNGTDFTSVPVRVSHSGYGSVVAITVTFTRTTGTSSTVDFEFQASYNNNTTWSTAYFVRIQVVTNETASSNVVIKTTLVNVHGISHLRLYRIVNNDGSTDLTACNATMSIGVSN